MTLYARFAAQLNDALDALEREGQLPPGLDRGAVAVEPPRDASHGDLATNAAMVLAKRAGTNPRALAALIAPRLEALDEVEAVEVAGPGFINIRLTPSVWTGELHAILAAGADYGRSEMGKGERVNVEYVSANPTGPMHMGHCRGAVKGKRVISDWPGLKPAALYEQRDLRPTQALDALISNAIAQHYALDLPRVMTTLFPNGTKPRRMDGLIRA